MLVSRSLGVAFPVGLLAVLAGRADGAIFTFSQQCSTAHWFSECTGGVCVPSGTQTFNNWGRSGCAGGLPVPGLGDTADISNATVILNGNAAVMEIVTNAGTNLTWLTGNITPTQPSTFNGAVMLSGAGTRTITGTLTNAGSWGDDASGAAISLSSAALTNAASGTWSMSASSMSRFASSSNSFTNAGTWQKLGPGTSTVTGVPIASPGSLIVAGGTLNLVQTNYPLAFGSGGTINVAAGATLTATDAALSGSVSGTNAGVISLATPFLAGALSLNVSGNPISWASGNLNGGGNTLTVEAATKILAGGAADRTVFSANVVNHGEWTESNAGSLTYLSTVTFANNGTLNLAGRSLLRFASSSNTLTNNGTLNKSSPAASTIQSIAVNHNGAINVLEGALNVAGTFPFAAGGASQTNVSSGATLAFADSPLSGTINGTNAGAFNLATTNLAGALTLNLTGNPVTLTGGNVNGGGNTLTIGANTDVLATGAADRILSSTSVINNGDWTEGVAGSLTYLSTVTFTNNGTLNLGGRSLLRFASSANTVTNNGVWNKSTPTTSTVQSVAVNQNGTLNVLEGAMTIAGTFPLTASASSLTNLSPGTTLTLGCPISGDIEGVSNGTVVLNGMSLAGNATINMGPGQVQAQTGANLNSNTLTMGSTSNYRNLTGVNKTYSSGTIVNNGDWLEATGGFNTYLSSAHIINNGTMTLDATTINRFGSSSNSITNNGTLRKVGANTASIVEMHLINNGLIDAEQGNLNRVNTFTFTQNPGATLRARAGAAVSLSGTVWNGGTLRGGGSITASNFTFSPAQMTISPGDPDNEGGTLTLQGNLVMTNDDVLNIELDARPGAPEGHDRLVISGTYNLGGSTMNVSLAPGFIPTVGDVYTVVSTNVVNSPSTFGAINFNVPEGVTFSVQYFTQSVRLTVTGIPCGTQDFNGDGDSGTDQDIEAFFACLGGNCCQTCYPGGADFNADGDTGTDADIESFFRVLGGGPC